MSDLYSDAQKIAADVLKAFKQGTIALLRTTRGASDPSSPWTPGAEKVTSIPLDAVVTGVKLQQIDGTLILAGDLVVTTSGASIAPLLSDMMLIDGVKYNIIKVEPRPAAGTPVAYAIFVRR